MKALVLYDVNSQGECVGMYCHDYQPADFSNGVVITPIASQWIIRAALDGWSQETGLPVYDHASLGAAT